MDFLAKVDTQEAVARGHQQREEKNVGRAVAAMRAGTEPGTHAIKRMQFLNREVSVCMQNENGPCPLLALVNVLLLRGTLKFHPNRSEITSDQLVELLAHHILEKNPVEGDDSTQATIIKTIDDIVQILPSLKQGLDVNVHFSGISDFEFDARISVFDMLDVRLYHGWVVGRDDEDVYKAVQSLSYNQLVDKVIMADESAGGDPNGKRTSASLAATLHESELLRKFLDETASQFTYAGLLQLHEQINDRQLCAFFRNNHFSTLYKMDGKLFLLATDVGYRTNQAIGWELLNDIDGNTELVSPTFGVPNDYVNPNDIGQKLIDARSNDMDADEMLALQLQRAEDDYVRRQPEYVARKAKKKKDKERRAAAADGNSEGGKDCVVM